MEKSVATGFGMHKVQLDTERIQAEILNMSASSPERADAQPVHADGVRLFLHTLGLDLDGVSLTEEQINKLAAQIPMRIEATSSPNGQRRLDVVERVGLIVTLGYEGAAAHIGMTYGSLHNWGSRTILKPHKPRRLEGDPSASDGVEDLRPLGAASLINALNFPPTAYDALDSWQERALCAQTDPEAFFPERGGSTREGKKVCAECEVKAECLDYAMKKDERFGIWGGLSERERRKLKKKLRRARGSSK